VDWIVTGFNRLFIAAPKGNLKSTWFDGHAFDFELLSMDA
jgi:hypothetical protein